MVATVETARSLEAAADVLRPDITLPSAVRWIRRRLTPIRVALLTLVTLWPDRALGPPQLSAVRAALMTMSALVALRTHVADHLTILPTPLGFQASRSPRDRAVRTRPHAMGADPARPGG